VGLCLLTNGNSLSSKLTFPTFAPVRRRGAVFAATMPMPETAVDKYRNALFYQHNIWSDKAALR